MASDTVVCLETSSHSSQYLCAFFMCENVLISKKNCTVKYLALFQLPLFKCHICSFLGQDDLPKDQNHQLFFLTWEVNMKLKLSLFTLTLMFFGLKNVTLSFHVFFPSSTFFCVCVCVLDLNRFAAGTDVCEALWHKRTEFWCSFVFSVPILLDRPYFQFPLCGTISDIF